MEVWFYSMGIKSHRLVFPSIPNVIPISTLSNKTWKRPRKNLTHHYGIGCETTNCRRRSIDHKNRRLLQRIVGGGRAARPAHSSNCTFYKTVEYSLISQGKSQQHVYTWCCREYETVNVSMFSKNVLGHLLNCANEHYLRSERDKPLIHLLLLKSLTEWNGQSYGIYWRKLE